MQAEDLTCYSFPIPYDDWPTNLVSKHRAVFAELDMLGPIADKLCKNGRYKVCIFGHSHKSEIDKDTWFVDDRIYANAGYWCGSKCTFVETEKNSEGYHVCLEPISVGHAHMVRALPTGLFGSTQSPTEIGS